MTAPRPRTVFMGTPEFAVPTLKALQESGIPVVAVLTQPPRPKGRGHQVHPSPVQTYAQACGIPVYTPSRLREGGADCPLALLKNLAPDLIVVVAYGLLLPQAVLDIPPLGCLNIHGSLLPRWRGASPVQRAVMAGDTETGVTLMRMDAGMDTGPLWAYRKTPIHPSTTALDLFDTLSTLGAQLLIDELPRISSGKARPEAQPLEGVTLAPKFGPHDFLIDWTQSAAAIERHIRGLFPKVSCMFQGKRLKILSARVEDRLVESPPGTIIDEALRVACGTQALRILTLIPEGGRPMEAPEWVRGLPHSTALIGTRLT